MGVTGTQGDAALCPGLCTVALSGLDLREVTGTLPDNRDYATRAVSRMSSPGGLPATMFS